MHAHMPAAPGIISTTHTTLRLHLYEAACASRALSSTHSQSTQRPASPVRRSHAPLFSKLCHVGNERGVFVYESPFSLCVNALAGVFRFVFFRTLELWGLGLLHPLFCNFSLSFSGSEQEGLSVRREEQQTDGRSVRLTGPVTSSNSPTHKPSLMSFFRQQRAKSARVVHVTGGISKAPESSQQQERRHC
ncbi:hypothetical protein BC567DRAFT_68479 [Phyllosticta citribraziliensis]